MWILLKLRKDGDDVLVSVSDEFGKVEAFEVELAEANVRRYRRVYDGVDELGYLL